MYYYSARFADTAFFMLTLQAYRMEEEIEGSIIHFRGGI